MRTPKPWGWRCWSALCAASVSLAVPVPQLLADAAPAAQPTRVDAVALRRDADEIERRIRAAGLLYGNASLDAYLQSVSDSLRGPGDPEPLRVRVIWGPWPNAFVLPNGATYATTALLDMLDSEAQLACVVGHEMTHLSRHHALEEDQARRTREGWTTALSIILGAAGAYYGGGQMGSALANLTSSAGDLWTMAAVSGYSRDHEREADQAGFGRLVDAGYDPVEATNVFGSLLARTPSGADQSRPYFASHPRLEERIASFQQLTAAKGVTGGRIEAARYFEALSDLPVNHAAAMLEAGYAAAARQSLERYVARQPGNVRAHYLLGKAWQEDAEAPDHVEHALEQYGRATALPSAPPDALRQMGLLHRERGENAAARDAFERFLVLDPQAVDAGLIRLYLQEMAAGP
jgi:beta-barrel assembly-enhancing protease